MFEQVGRVLEAALRRNELRLTPWRVATQGDDVLNAFRFQAIQNTVYLFNRLAHAGEMGHYLHIRSPLSLNGNLFSERPRRTASSVCH